MFRVCRRVLLLALLYVSAQLFAEDRRSTDVQLVVSVFNDAAVDDVSLARAEDQAAKILRRARVELVFLDCKNDASGRCLRLSDQGHFALRIVPRSRSLRSEVFGAAFLGDDGRGTQADVFFIEVQRLGTNARVNVPELLGHVIAHELGHLMLGTHAHSASGIMRPRWEDAELNLLVRGNLLFNPEQVKVMRARMRPTDTSAVEAVLRR
jgi:hypothetical protein